MIKSFEDPIVNDENLHLFELFWDDTFLAVFIFNKNRFSYVYAEEQAIEYSKFLKSAYPAGTLYYYPFNKPRQVVLHMIWKEK